MINNLKFYRATIYKYIGKDNSKYPEKEKNGLETEDSIIKRYDTVYKLKKDGKVHYISATKAIEYKTSNDIRNLKIGEEFVNLHHKLIPINLYYIRNKFKLAERKYDKNINKEVVKLYLGVNK